MENGIKIILASASPRRKEILSWLLPSYDVMPSDIDETHLPAEDPADYTRRMAYGKMMKRAQLTAEDSVLVIGSDTTVFLENRIFGKPKSAEDAKEILHTLNGKEHLVATAVAMFYRKGGEVQIRRTVDKTRVCFRKMTDAEIDGFVESGVPMGKAGAYAIQDRAYHPVDHICGCYTGVMGLPFCHVAAMLAEFGLIDCRDRHGICSRGTGVRCEFIPSIEIEDIPFTGF